MKNAMKKLMSVLLVAVLLISAVPFAASAAEGNHNVTVVIKSGDSELANMAVEITDGETCEGVMTWVANTAGINLSNYTVQHYYWADAEGDTNNGYYAGETGIHLNGTLSVRLVENEKIEETTTPTTTPTEATVEPVTFVIKVSETGAANTGTVVYTGSKEPVNGESCKVGDLLNYCWNSKWTGVYEFDHAYSVSKNATTYNKDTAIAAGDEVHIMLKPVSADDDDSSSSSSSSSSSTVTSTKDLNDIILNIFVNKDYNNCKTIKLNGYSILDDDKITLNEIMNSVVTTYYTATDSNKGLQGDGLYYTTGSFMYNWLTDSNKVDAIDDIAAKRAEGTVTINIMVTNATAKSTTTTADSSNPKTGDSIYTAMTVMGISAASLAAVMYVYTKKRQAI